ncbi:glycoside hydrolase family 11 protein [Flammeovirga aprica]|uniref:endo-1,4-beta-xylanase n=1 Tax=Flammeovirga aprica JL-4 TaxID=694437 RepID=A0A7X9P329_9BACT|nr:glycoside hydrolase family 11 protein [Flammeovirga aprica]NME68661.1 T9SS type A sorting domain-containing protein [Flammeovirga aprica JL-4]
MKKLLNLCSMMSVFLLPLLCIITPFSQVNAQTICNNQIGNQGGYTYEYWKDSGNGCITLNNGGNFYVSWNNIGNLLARKGKRPGVKNQTVTYGANYQPSGNSYLCVYGWTTSPLVEYYIVESWGSWRPPGGTPKGSVTTDGGTYDIYETTRIQQPSIEGTKTFQQYWSVRRSKRTSGTVTCANHFNAWGSLGMNMGNLYEVSFTVEGYQSSGTCDVYSMTMGTSNGNGGGSGNSNTIKVRAKGISGQEKLNVRIDNQTIQTLSLTNNFKIYTVNTNSSGGVNVEYFNDTNGRDVQVDWIEINGSRKQAEQQSYNTAVWQNNTCGGQYSEWMHCNGVIGFGNTSGARQRNLSSLEEHSESIIFPNPIKENYFTVKNIDLGNINEILIYTSQGQLVETITTSGGTTTVQLPATLHQGIYVFHVVGTANTLTQRVVIH